MVSLHPENYSLQIPEMISKDQLYKICHVSKRKALWLLENGVIPCVDSGKKTRRFTIKTVDVVKYLRKLDEGKIKELPPPGIFSSSGPRKRTNFVRVDSAKFTAYFKETVDEVTGCVEYRAIE